MLEFGSSQILFAISTLVLTCPPNIGPGVMLNFCRIVDLPPSLVHFRTTYIPIRTIIHISRINFMKENILNFVDLFILIFVFGNVSSRNRVVIG